MLTEDKPREMGRSILPSRMRSSHYLQHKLSRSRRHRDRQALQKMYRDGLEWDDYESGLDRYQLDRSMKELVQDRRDYDHLNHFYRWSEAVTANLEPSDRLDAMRAVLPVGLIGNHAISHLEAREHFEMPDKIVSARPYGDRKYDRESRKRLALKEQYIRRLNRVAQAGLLAEFEQMMLNVIAHNPVPYYMEPVWVKRPDGTSMRMGQRRHEMTMPPLTRHPYDSHYVAEDQIKAFVGWIFMYGDDGQNLGAHRRAMRRWLHRNNY